MVHPHFSQKPKRHYLLEPSSSQEEEIIISKLKQNRLRRLEWGCEYHGYPAYFESSHRALERVIRTGNLTNLKQLKLGHHLALPVWIKLLTALGEAFQNNRQFQLESIEFIMSNTITTLRSTGTTASATQQELLTHLLQQFLKQQTHLRSFKVQGCPNHVVKDFIPILQDHHNLQTIQLMDCPNIWKHVTELADLLYMRGGISHLSLRHNKVSLCTPRPSFVLVTAPVFKSLDLSLCDLQDSHVLLLAQALQRRRPCLPHLNLSGNYQISMEGGWTVLWPALEAHVSSANLSHCDWTESRTQAFLQLLTKHPHTESTTGANTAILQELILHGTRFSTEESILTLCHWIQANSSVQRLLLHAPTNTPDNSKVSISPQAWELIASSVQQSYQLEELELGHPPPSELSTSMRQVFRLNRTGRRLFRTTNGNVGLTEWTSILERASQMDLNILYQVVQESSDLLRGHTKERE